MTVVTKKVTDRRSLHFDRLADILDDAESIGASASVRATGNWTPAQIVSHVGDFLHASLDGMATGRLWMRIFRLLKSSVLSRPMSAGFKIPAQFQSLAPDPGVTWDDAMAKLRRGIERVEGGERMNAVSPFLGPMSHDEWEKMHCRHAEMHFSFMHGDGDVDGDGTADERG